VERRLVAYRQQQQQLKQKQKQMAVAVAAWVKLEYKSILYDMVEVTTWT